MNVSISVDGTTMDLLMVSLAFASGRHSVHIDLIIVIAITCVLLHCCTDDVDDLLLEHITKTRLFKYTENCTTKNGNFSDKKIWYFLYFCSKRGGSNEYPQSMFLSRNKENNVYPCKPQFYYIKVGFKGVKII